MALAATLKQAAKLDARHPDPESRIDGVRSDIRWQRAQKKAEIDESTGRSKPQRARREELSNHDLVNAVRGMKFRTGRAWTPMDAATLRELHIRAMGYGEAKRARTYQIPRWLPEAVGDAIGTMRRGWGLMVFLSILIHAYRQGAVGVVMSYEEWQAICGVGSRDTWRRWTAELEAAGFVRIIQTWDEDHGLTGRPRRRDRLYYRIGAELEKVAGFGILEGAPGLDDRPAAWAARAAQGARKRANDATDQRKGELWERARQSEQRAEHEARSPWVSSETTIAQGSARADSDTEQPSTQPVSEHPATPKSGADAPPASIPSSTTIGPHPACPSGCEALPARGSNTQQDRAKRGASGPGFQHAPAASGSSAPPSQPAKRQSPPAARRPEGGSDLRLAGGEPPETPAVRAHDGPSGAPAPGERSPPGEISDSERARRRIVARRHSLRSFLENLAGDEGSRFAGVAREFLEGPAGEDPER